MAPGRKEKVSAAIRLVNYYNQNDIYCFKGIEEDENYLKCVACNKMIKAKKDTCNDHLGSKTHLKLSQHPDNLQHQGSENGVSSLDKVSVIRPPPAKRKVPKKVNGFVGGNNKKIKRESTPDIDLSQHQTGDIVLASLDLAKVTDELEDNNISILTASPTTKLTTHPRPPISATSPFSSPLTHADILPSSASNVRKTSPLEDVRILIMLQEHEARMAAEAAAFKRKQEQEDELFSMKKKLLLQLEERLQQPAGADSDVPPLPDWAKSFLQ